MENFLRGLFSRSILIILVFVMSIGLAGSYLYFTTKSSKEKKAGVLYNDVMSFALTNQVNTDLGSFSKDKLEKILPELLSIYEKYPNNNNGLRAAMTIGDIYFELEQFDKANEYYQIFKKKKRHYLSVNAFYREALCEEAKGNYAGAIEILVELKKEYEKHFLFVEIVFAECRNYILQKDYDLAIALYNELLATEDIAKGNDAVIKRKLIEANILKNQNK